MSEMLAMFPHIGIKDIFEIALIVFLIYKIIVNAKDTRMWIMIRGLTIVLIVYILVLIFQFDAILTIFKWILYWGAIVIVIIFQTDIRRFIEKIGIITKNISSKDFITVIKSIFKKTEEKNLYISEDVITELANACFSMGKVKTGALIVVEKDVPLNEYIDTGIEVDARTTSQLLINIFEKNTPLHDGAVIIKDNRVLSATCYLPLSNNLNISKSLGTRHRAAVGMTENSDAIVIVVSEETGNVSIVVDREIMKIKNIENFIEIINKYNEKEAEISRKEKDEGKFKHIFTATLIGTLFWMLLINGANPISSKTLYNIPVKIINTEALTEIGQSYEVTSGEYASVRIQDRRDVIDKITENDIELIANMKNLSIVNAIPIEVKSNQDIQSIQILGNATTTISIEESATIEIPITIEREGATKEGYFVHDISLSEETIKITAPETLSFNISEAKVIIPIENATNDMVLKIKPQIFDQEGNVINENKYSTNIDSITANISIYPAKKVPVILNLSNDSANEYSITNTELSQNEVYIAGTQETLDSINEINIETHVTYSGNNQYVRVIDMEEFLPENVELAQNSKITFSTEFIPLESIVLTIPSSQIKLINTNNKLEYTFKDNEFNIEYRGTNEMLKSIIAEDIVITADMENVDVGDYTVVLDTEDKDGLIKVGISSIRISVEEKG